MNDNLKVQSVSPESAVREAFMHVSTSVEITNHFLLHFLGDAKDTEGAVRSLYAFLQANRELNAESGLKIAPCVGEAMFATLEEIVRQGWDLQSALCTLEVFAGRLDIEYGIWVDNEQVQKNNPLFPVPPEGECYLDRLEDKIEEIKRMLEPAPSSDDPKPGPKYGLHPEPSRHIEED